MKKGLLLIAAIIFIAFNANAQLPITQDFESGDITTGGWEATTVTGTLGWYLDDTHGENDTQCAAVTGHIGGGASEIELAKRLRAYARSIGGREQLAIEVYANALEIIPKTLVENAGYNPVDLIVELRSKHETEEGNSNGINIDTGKPDNMVKMGVIEPLSVLTQAIQSATEVSSMILKIDDVIAASGLSKGPEV